MPFSYLPRKTKYRVTLEIEAMEDFNPHQLDWEKLLDIQGSESIKTYVEDLTLPDVW